MYIHGFSHHMSPLPHSLLPPTVLFETVGRLESESLYTLREENISSACTWTFPFIHFLKAFNMVSFSGDAQ